MAIAALIMGIASIFFPVGIIFNVLGFIFSIVSLKKGKTPKGCATAGLVTTIIGTVWGLFWTVVLGITIS